MTHEGADAIHDLIAELTDKKPVDSVFRFKWEPMMKRACKDHVIDQGPEGLTGHRGSDGTAPHQRMGRYGNLPLKSAENIVYGERTPLEILI